MSYRVNKVKSVSKDAENNAAFASTGSIKFN